jgi:hypothetical protein
MDRGRDSPPKIKRSGQKGTAPQGTVENGAVVDDRVKGVKAPSADQQVFLRSL